MQLDFMAEQCSQTDLHPLYLLPNTASFYTWIPAIGFGQGVPKTGFFSISERKKTLSITCFSIVETLIQGRSSADICANQKENIS